MPTDNSWWTTCMDIPSRCDSAYYTGCWVVRYCLQPQYAAHRSTTDGVTHAGSHAPRTSQSLFLNMRSEPLAARWRALSRRRRTCRQYTIQPAPRWPPPYRRLLAWRWLPRTLRLTSPGRPGVAPNAKIPPWMSKRHLTPMAWSWLLNTLRWPPSTALHLIIPVEPRALRRRCLLVLRLYTPSYSSIAPTTPF